MAEARFYSDVVECLPVDQAVWVRFSAGAGKIFSLYDNGAPPFDRSLHKYLPWSHIHMIPVPRNSGTNFELEGVIVTWTRYILIHSHYLAIEAGFYSDVVKCLPVNPATWARFPAGPSRLIYFRSTTQA